MQNTKLLLTSFTFVGLLLLAGCSFPGVYKIDIQQGNVITQNMMNQLRPGMTRQQVRYIMGKSLLADTFHPDRWDYLYSLQPAGGERQQERVSVFFNESQQLARVSGDFKPGVSRDEVMLGKDAATGVIVPTALEAVSSKKSDTPPRPGSLLDQIQGEVDRVEAVPMPPPEATDEIEQ